MIVCTAFKNKAVNPIFQPVVVALLGVPLEDEHEEADGLLRGVLAQVFEAVPDEEDVLLGLLVVLALESRVAGQERVDQHSYGPDVAVRVRLLLRQHFGG